jgi:hypothetical protein
METVLNMMIADLIILYTLIIFNRHQKRKLSEEAFFFNLKIWLISRGVKDV